MDVNADQSVFTNAFPLFRWTIFIRQVSTNLPISLFQCYQYSLELVLEVQKTF